MQFAPLLFPAARAQCQPEHYQQLAQLVTEIRTWNGFVSYAEDQGMAPLFLAHAREAGITLPEQIQLQLQGLAMRHRLSSQARAKTLVEIIQASRTANIDLVLLKGAATSRLVYPQPALRPMRDIDLLTRPAQAKQLHSLLMEMGFRPAHESDELPSPHHLPSLARDENGFRVTVEAHFNVFDPAWRARPPAIDRWIDRKRLFVFEGIEAYTLSLEDLLWHTYQHMINGPMRLVSIADLVSIAEHFVNEIDWEKVRRTRPGVLQALALFHPHAPLSEQLTKAAHIPANISQTPIGEDFGGWPRISISTARQTGWKYFLRQTFMPGEWWLRLYYGIENGRTLTAYRWIIHPLEIARIASVRLAQRLPGANRY